MMKMMKYLVTACIVGSAAAALALPPLPPPPGGGGGGGGGTDPVPGNQNIPNLTGWWTSDGGGTAQVYQEAKKVTALFVTPDFAHKVTVSWNGVTVAGNPRFTGNMTRVNRANNCTLQLLIAYEMQPDGSLYVTANLDPSLTVPACSDLVPGQTYFDINRKVFGS